MKKITKNIGMAIVAVLIAVGFSAYTMVENKEVAKHNKRTTPTNGWYELAIAPNTAPQYDDQANQVVLAHAPNHGSGPDCTISNLYKPCAVYLVFDELIYDGPDDIEAEEMSVEELLEFNGVSIDASAAGNTDGYTRRLT